MTTNDTTYTEIKAGIFEAAIKQSGLKPPDTPIEFDNQYHRFTAYAEDTKTSGWYKVNGVIGFFGSWAAQEIVYYWKPRNRQGPVDEKDTNRQIEEHRKEQQKIYEEAALEAKREWLSATPFDDTTSHPYLETKQVRPVPGLRIKGDNLIVPRISQISPINFEQDIASIQTIDPSGRKDNQFHGKAKGTCFPIPGKEDVIVVVEGLSTGLSVHEATGDTVLVAFGAGNLGPVAGLAKKTYPNSILLIGADADEVGMSAARKAGLSSGALVIKPEFLEGPSKDRKDFNDLARSSGIDSVKSLINTRVRLIQLAFLSPATLDRVRKKEAENLKIGVSALNKEIAQIKKDLGLIRGVEENQAKARVYTGDEGEEEPVIADPEPWPEKVDGGILLEDISAAFKRYVILPEHADTALALWTVHTYCYNERHCSPILGIKSPIRRCGKSQTLQVLLNLSRRALPASNISAAALFRSIDRWKPTLITDEADTYLKMNDELKGIYNSGHTKALAFVLRVEGEKYTPRRFSTWAPKAIGLIGDLPDTIHDRAIEIVLKRKLTSEEIGNINELDGEIIRQKCLGWALDNASAIRKAKPEILACLNDRDKDNWDTLFVIADIAGGEWPIRARAAAAVLSKEEDTYNDTRGVQLLEDIYLYFEEKKKDKVFSEDLVCYLVVLTERPWSEYYKGTPITTRQMADLLRPFGITSRNIRIEPDQKKGYELKNFLDAFARYLVKEPSRRPKQDGAGVSEENQSVPEDPRDGSKTAPKGRSQNDWDGGTDKKGGKEGEEEKNFKEPPFSGGDESPTDSYKLITSPAEFGNILPTLLESKALALDFETTGLDPHRDRARIASISTRDLTVLVDLDTVPIQNLEVLFTSGNRHILAQNAKFDLKFLGKAGIWLPSGKLIVDPMIVAQLLGAGTEDGKLDHCGLASLAKKYLGIELDKTLQKSDWSEDLSQEQLVYAAKDSRILFDLCDKVYKELISAGLLRVFEVEMLALPAIAWMELAGLPIDEDKWRALTNRLEQRVKEIYSELDLLYGRPVNWNSPKQVLAVLRERSHKVFSTGYSVLKTLAHDPLIDLLLEHRETAKLTTTYGIEWLKRHLHPATNRVHADFMQLGSCAGRMSCTKPNLQQLPRDCGYRGLVKAGEGNKIIKADYSQIELRIAAVLANDEAMLSAYRNSEDLHIKTAAAILGIPLSEIIKQQRQLAKGVNFGLIYGMGATRLAEYLATEYGVSVSIEEAHKYRQAYFETYQGVQAWHASIREDVTETRTLLGRRRQNVTRFTEKLNSPDQGSGADGLKLAMGLLYEHRGDYPGVRLVNSIHDELLFECPADQAGEAAEWIKGHMIDAMEEVVDHKVPIEVETSIGDSWATD